MNDSITEEQKQLAHDTVAGIDPDAVILSHSEIVDNEGLPAYEVRAQSERIDFRVKYQVRGGLCVFQNSGKNLAALGRVIPNHVYIVL